MQRLPWEAGEFDSLAPEEADTRCRRADPAWLAAGTAAVVLCLAAVIWAIAGFAANTADAACQYHEAREGSGFEKLEGAQIDDLARLTPLRIAVRTTVEPSVAPGTVVRMSGCDVPGDADAVAYVAVMPSRRGGGS